MKQRLLVLAIAFLAVSFVEAQPESPVDSEMDFVNELRKRGDAALAMDYLLRLGKNPSPQLAKELPFELAKTRLLIGTEEPGGLKTARSLQASPR